ncbi:MAG TPA: chromosome segregation SMC family protein, partial [Candidatus Deferrimicrobium sp.]|nr:chromosome segregation SMC family protein [Candidatus Deferrimicrobium sp.]
ATFIPLEELKHIITSETGRFAFIEKLDKKMRTINAILQNTLIAENLREAIDLWLHKIKENLYINVITPYGDFVSREGIITGGANKNFAEQLIPELKAKLKSSKENLEKISSELDINNVKYKRLVVLINEIQRKQENVQESIKTKDRRLEETNRRIESNQIFIEKTEKELTSITQEIDGSVLVINNLKQNWTELQQRLQDMQAERDELKGEIEKSEIKDLFQEVRKIESEISRMEGEIRANQATRREKENQINVILVRNLQENKNRIEAIESALIQLQNEIDQFQKSQAEQETQLNQLNELDTQTKSEVTQLQNEIEMNQATIDSHQKEIASLNRKIERLRQQTTDIKVKNEASTTKLFNIQKKIQELEVDLISITEPIDENKVELEIQALANKKKTLEPVNALSVQQYHEVKLRFDELTARREELNQERKVIVDFINKIEFEKKAIFFNLFNRINKEFGVIFEMIAGGTAKMELENPENPFEGGITILAKPGGKKVKSIQAMSGGEKSLTALALIFAMQKVDPSPFYVFDEIDAALDVMNVRKVAKVIEQISKESQCIMITHRDIAMRYTNQLYGVTNLNGVSKVISVALTDEGTLQALSS